MATQAPQSNSKAGVMPPRQPHALVHGTWPRKIGERSALRTSRALRLAVHQPEFDWVERCSRVIVPRYRKRRSRCVLCVLDQPVRRGDPVQKIDGFFRASDYPRRAVDCAARRRRPISAGAADYPSATSCREVLVEAPGPGPATHRYRNTKQNSTARSPPFRSGNQLLGQ